MPKIPKWAYAVGIVVLLAVILTASYNGMVKKEQSVQNAWAQVEVQYQRRSDLIPQLVDVVQGIADQEQAVLIGVTEARASATQIDVDDLGDAQQLQAFDQAQGELSSALSRLLVTVEAYPQVASQQNFIALQSQVEGTENRIAVARRDFNEVVTDYNTTIKKFPRVMFASMFGFEDYERFEADKGAEEAPDIDFDINEEESP